MLYLAQRSAKAPRRQARAIERPAPAPNVWFWPECEAPSWAEHVRSARGF
jgi:hypothetical protein